MFKRFRKNEKGQGMVEYGLILALVSIISITALGGIGGNIKDKFDKVVSGIGGSVVEDDNIVEDDTYTEEEIQNLIGQGYIPIATAGELNQLRHNKVQTFGGKQYRSGLDKKYIQVANIDLGGIDNFEPIGTDDNEFTGTYDGGGYTISNLKIDRGSNNYAGLFGIIDGSAELKNIGLVNADVSGGDYVGGLVGFQYGSTITNSYASGSVSGTGSQVGGLVGFQYGGGSITNSYSSGEVSGGGSQVGGLVGQQSDGTITNSYASGSVNGGRYVGGLVGYQYSGRITNSYASGNVSGGGYVGGLVGQQYSGRITNSYWDKQTTGQTTSSGTGATGKTTVEMKIQETFSDWDFDTIWQIKSGEYPTLQ